MTAPAVTRDLVVAHTRALKLPGIARVFEGLARQARDAHWPHEDYLQEVLGAELASRHESVIRQRLRDARFTEVKTLDTFDFQAAEGLNATQIHTLARGEWVTAPETNRAPPLVSRGRGRPGQAPVLGPLHGTRLDRVDRLLSPVCRTLAAAASTRFREQCGGLIAPLGAGGDG